MYMKRMIEDSTPKLDKVIGFGGCKKHKAERGEPCGWISFNHRWICGRRAKTAGFNAPISAKSLSQRPHHGKR